jgi:hypothetical protein
MQQRGQLLDPILDPVHDGMTDVGNSFGGIGNPVDQAFGNVRVAFIIGSAFRGHADLLST